MTLATDTVNGCVLSNEAHRKLLPKKCCISCSFHSKRSYASCTIRTIKTEHFSYVGHSLLIFHVFHQKMECGREGGSLPLPIMHINTGKCSIVHIISTGITFRKSEFSQMMAKLK